MSNRDTVTIKKFKIKDLFEVMSSKKIYHAVNVDIKEQQKIGYYPYVVRSEVNRGIRGYIKAPKETLNDANTISFAQDTFIAFYQKQPYFTGNNVKILKPLFKPNEKILLYIECALNKAMAFNSWGMGSSFEYIENIEIEIPITNNNQPDWEYMENYITEIENKYINKLEQHNNEKIEQALKVTGLSKEALNEELKVEPAKRYEKFRVGDLFDKKTIKGVPKSKEKLQENKTGYHVFGQNIKYQYPQKVLLEEQYLQTIQTPILAYSSSTAQIGYIKENFYRTGDNGAFQGLFPKKTNVAIHSLLYILVVLKKQFDWFGYATEMGNILNLEITLPATNENTPDFEYMEKAIYIYFRQVIQNWKLSNEKEIEELKQVINK